MSHQSLKWRFHVTPVAFYFWFITLNYFIKFLYTETFLCLVSHTACRVNTSACRPLDSASATQCQPWPFDAPSHLVRWRLSSCLPLICRLVVVPHAVTCLCLTSPFVAQPRHASILDPPSLFVPAGCRTSSHTSAYQLATASRLAVLLPSPMNRHCCCCSQFAGVFASVTIVIVALVTHRQAGAGIVTLVVVVVIDDVHSHCGCRYIHSRHCNRHCHRRRCHCPPGRCHHC